MKRTTVAALIGSGVALVAAQPASAAETAPVYRVTQEGMTAEESARLAEAYRIPDALHENGAFGYVSDEFAKVPMRQVATGKDESGRRTDSEALDTRALANLKPIGADEAFERASWLTELIGLTDLELNPKVSHAKLTLSDRAGNPTSQYALDTTVSHDLTLGGLPATGQGAKLRITFAPDGTVTQLSSSLRKLEKAGEEPIIPSDEARKACERLYDEGVRQGEPTLGYLLPALGAVEAIYPSYTCNPSSERGEQAHLQVPAVEGIGPKATIEVTRSGEKILGRVVEAAGDGSVYKWSSSSTVLTENEGEEIAYERRPRAKTTDAETLSLEVTDRDGLSATASITLHHDGFGVVDTNPGGGGFGKLAVGPTDVGIEQTVDEWQCAQDSAIGFKNVMAAHSIPTAFDWRGWAAFEKDFKDQALGGWDHLYVDNVDAQWYTGHGWSGGFTFKSSVDDTQVTPGDARWGNRDLEWMQLESCQVLADTNGSHDYFSRWGGAVDGLHMLNGFHTNAYCVGGGTGGTFASYLFPRQILFWTLPALTVRNAWAQMAIDKEPNNVVYRSMGNIGPGWVTNIGDYFWGQGPTGPDISAAGRIGQWSITGTV
jgi:Family of unknown function (DUF6345)